MRRLASTPWSNNCNWASSLVIDELYCVINAIALSAQSFVTVTPSITCCPISKSYFCSQEYNYNLPFSCPNISQIPTRILDQLAAQSPRRFQEDVSLQWWIRRQDCEGIFGPHHCRSIEPYDLPSFLGGSEELAALHVFLSMGPRKKFIICLARCNFFVSFVRKKCKSNELRC
jgi:hypothetical protein